MRSLLRRLHRHRPAASLHVGADGAGRGAVGQPVSRLLRPRRSLGGRARRSAARRLHAGAALRPRLLPARPGGAREPLARARRLAAAARAGALDRLDRAGGHPRLLHGSRPALPQPGGPRARWDRARGGLPGGARRAPGLGRGAAVRAGGRDPRDGVRRAVSRPRPRPGAGVTRRLRSQGVDAQPRAHRQGPAHRHAHARQRLRAGARPPPGGGRRRPGRGGHGAGRPRAGHRRAGRPPLLCDGHPLHKCDGHRLHKWCQAPFMQARFRGGFVSRIR